MSLILNDEERVLYAASRALLRTAPNAFESTAVVLLEDHKAVVEKLQREIDDLRAAYDMADVDCDGCGGTGRITFLGEEGKCPRCHGSGKLVGP